MTWLAQSCALLFVVTVVGGAAPLLLRRSDRLLHLLIAFATGIFLGVVFLDLLPEVGHTSAGAGVAHALEEPWLFVLLGVLALYLLESLTIHPGGHQHGHAHGAGEDHGEADRRRHRTVGYASLFGLTVHAFTAGLGLTAGLSIEGLRETLFWSLVSHKAAESISLTAVFMLASFSTRSVWLLVIAFALATPLGAFVGASFVPSLDSYGLAVLTALAAGTFLFVALCDLLPEVFHHRIDVLAKVALLGAGIGVSLLLPGAH